MIRFSFSITNPWAKSNVNGKDYVVWDKKLSTNWAAELQITKWSPTELFRLEVDTCWRGIDHAGPSIHIELFGYMFACKIYNVNHWDYETGTWEVYDPENEDEE
jgi:hypothetical protein